jgi:opacity protein-like surface antigen
MSHTRLALAAILSVALLSSAAHAADTAQDQTSILIDTIRANRKAFVAVNLDLSAEEAKGFWPLYDKYQAELNPISDKVLAVVADYSDHFSELKDEHAAQLMKDYLAAEAERIKVRQGYLPEFSKVVSGRTVARFYQLENKIDVLLRYELAAKIPVIEQKAAPAAK